MFSMVFLQIVINFIVAFVLVMAVMPKSIQYLKKLKFGQIEREEGLESHKAKVEHQQWEELFLFFVLYWLFTS